MHKLLKAFRFLTGVIRGVFSSRSYYIKPGYRHRKAYTYLDTRGRNEIYQMEVYEIAKRIIKENNFKTITDFGCGSAKKLMHHFDDYETIGVEVSPTYEYLQETYPNKKWLKAENVKTDLLKSDLVICADVIEHVLEPDKLLRDIDQIGDFEYLLISTPERDIVRSAYDYGPPGNKHHIREWNGFEFEALISDYFDIVSHQITHFRQATQLVICKKKGK